MFGLFGKKPSEEEIMQEMAHLADTNEAFRVAERARVLATQLRLKAAELERLLASGQR